MHEEMVLWTPAAHLATKYCLVDIINQSYELSIVLWACDNENDKLIIRGRPLIRAYQIINVPLGGYDSWTFFEIKNSEYAAWIDEQSHGFYKEQFFIHYRIIATNATIDLLCFDEPQIEVA